MLMNCIYCDNKVIAYCDFAIALEPKHKAKDGKLLAGVDSKVFTCDAPLCKKHAVSVGHICGKNGDSIDYCEHHFYEQNIYEVLFEDDAEEKTVSRMKKLSEEERVNEIAVMIGGQNPSVSAMNSARELLSL